MIMEILEDIGLFIDFSSYSSSILPLGFDFHNEDRRGEKHQF
jgi:hypothetical protein